MDLDLQRSEMLLPNPLQQRHSHCVELYVQLRTPCSSGSPNQCAEVKHFIDLVGQNSCYLASFLYSLAVGAQALIPCPNIIIVFSPGLRQYLQCPMLVFWKTKAGADWYSRGCSGSRQGKRFLGEANKIGQSFFPSLL